MQTNISQTILDTGAGGRANEILRRCVHCGFCLATCPTYNLLGDELDSPRGRIYLIKQMLEGQKVGSHTLKHLDRCLTCRSCETTCPSGVEYGHLLDVGRELAESKISRPLWQKFIRRICCLILPYPKRFGFLVRFAGLFKWILPGPIKQQIRIDHDKNYRYPQAGHDDIVLTLKGCVQSVLEPDINISAAQLLDACGIQMLEIEGAGCCGAINHHLNDETVAKAMMRQNIDAWWPLIEKGNVTAICITASGCAAMVQDYGQQLLDDPEYADKAAYISGLCLDISEVLLAQKGMNYKTVSEYKRVAFHSPCTLQHAMKITGKVEQLLASAGYELTEVSDSHLCCGSAGTYSIFHPIISNKLRANKLQSLSHDQPDYIVTANIGCLRHLQTNSEVPVKHWLQLLVKK